MMRVSINYEKAQYNLYGNFSGSGFSVEDLPSNYLGALEEFNRKIPGSTGLDRAKIEILCYVLGIDNSMKMFNYGSGPTENRSHIPQLWTYNGYRIVTRYKVIYPGMVTVPYNVTEFDPNACDPCARAKKELPAFYNDFPVDKAGSNYSIIKELWWSHPNI